MTDLGYLEWFLGLQINQNHETGTITISQSQYIMDLIESLGMSECHPESTPLATNYNRMIDPDGKLYKDCKFVSNLKAPYRTVIGKLMYAMVGTRPDIATAVSIACRFQENPQPIHWMLAERIVRYLKGSSDIGIKYSGDARDLCGFMDADFAACPITYKSISGHAFVLGGGAISWYSKKQATTAQSTAEAEYISANEAAREAVWIRRLLNDLGQRQRGPTQLYEDNQSCIHLVPNPQAGHKRTKHIPVKFHYIRELVKDGVIKIEFKKTREQVADVLTKGLGTSKFCEFREALGVTCLSGSVGNGKPK
jgi:hypothetical protein